MAKIWNQQRLYEEDVVAAKKEGKGNKKEGRRKKGVGAVVHGWREDSEALRK